mgnify:CR=1 FL=1
MKIRIENIVGVIEFDKPVDLNQVLEKLKHLGIRRLKRLPGLKLRVNNTAILIYKSKVIIAGVKNIKELETKAQRLIEVLNSEGIKVSMKSIRVENVTATVDLGFRVDLRKVAEILKGAYDPDYRPCVVAKVLGATVMLYNNGKALIIGAKDIDQVSSIVEFIIGSLNFRIRSCV